MQEPIQTRVHPLSRIHGRQVTQHFIVFVVCVEDGVEVGTQRPFVVPLAGPSNLVDILTCQVARYEIRKRRPDVADCGAPGAAPVLNEEDLLDLFHDA